MSALAEAHMRDTSLDVSLERIIDFKTIYSLPKTGLALAGIDDECTFDRRDHS
jgi:hypothetical protein